MKRIFATIITLLLAFSFVVSANAVQPVTGTPVDWSKPNAQIKFTPSKNSDAMEPDSTLITFINSSPNSTKTYRIEIRKVSNYNMPILCTDSSTNSKNEITNESINFFLAKGSIYSIKINSNDNTLNIHKPDGTVVATFDLIDGFKNTNCFVYGECQVFPGGKISLIKNDNIAEQQSISSEVVTGNNTPSGTEEKHTNALRPVESKPTNSETFDDNTNDENNKKDSSSVLKTVCLIVLIILILALIGFSVIMFLRYKNGKAKEERAKLKNTSADTQSVPNAESATHPEPDHGATVGSYAGPYNMEVTHLPSNDLNPSATTPTQDVSFSSPKKPEPNTTLFTPKKIDSRWKTALDAHLLDYAEQIFVTKRSIISIDKPATPLNQQPPVAPTTMSTPTAPAVSATTATPIAMADTFAQIEGKTKSESTSDAYVLANAYSSKDGLDLIRNTFGYDSVQFAEVSSSCLSDFSFGIFDKYQLRINEAEYSSYIIISEKYLMPNPSRFGVAGNPTLDDFFLSRMHPEIAFDFFHSNSPVTISNLANSSLIMALPARVEKQNTTFVLVEKGKIYIRK